MIKYCIGALTAIMLACVYLLWAGVASLQSHQAVWPWSAPPGSPGTHYVCVPRAPMPWDAPGPSYKCE